MTLFGKTALLAVACLALLAVQTDTAHGGCELATSPPLQHSACDAAAAPAAPPQFDAAAASAATTAAAEPPPQLSGRADDADGTTAQARAPPRRPTLYAKYRQQAAAQIAHMVALAESCADDASVQTRVWEPSTCDRHLSLGPRLNALKVWAERDAGWDRFLQSARSLMMTAPVLQQATSPFPDILEVSQYLHTALLLRVFPYEDQTQLTQWHAALITQGPVTQHQREELISTLVMLSDIHLELGTRLRSPLHLEHSHRAMQLVKELSHISRAGASFGGASARQPPVFGVPDVYMRKLSDQIAYASVDVLSEMTPEQLSELLRELTSEVLQCAPPPGGGAASPGAAAAHEDCLWELKDALLAEMKLPVGVSDSGEFVDRADEDEAFLTQEYAVADDPVGGRMRSLLDAAVDLLSERDLRSWGVRCQQPERGAEDEPCTSYIARGALSLRPPPGIPPKIWEMAMGEWREDAFSPVDAAAVHDVMELQPRLMYGISWGDVHQEAERDFNLSMQAEWVPTEREPKPSRQLKLLASLWPKHNLDAILRAVLRAYRCTGALAKGASDGAGRGPDCHASGDLERRMMSEKADSLRALWGELRRFVAADVDLDVLAAEFVDARCRGGGCGCDGPGGGADPQCAWEGDAAAATAWDAWRRPPRRGRGARGRRRVWWPGAGAVEALSVAAGVLVGARLAWRSDVRSRLARWRGGARGKPPESASSRRKTAAAVLRMLEAQQHPACDVLENAIDVARELRVDAVTIQRAVVKLELLRRRRKQAEQRRSGRARTPSPIDAPPPAATAEPPAAAASTRPGLLACLAGLLRAPLLAQQPPEAAPSTGCPEAVQASKGRGVRKARSGRLPIAPPSPFDDPLPSPPGPAPPRSSGGEKPASPWAPAEPPSPLVRQSSPGLRPSVSAINSSAVDALEPTSPICGSLSEIGPPQGSGEFATRSGVPAAPRAPAASVDSAATHRLPSSDPRAPSPPLDRAASADAPPVGGAQAPAAAVNERWKPESAARPRRSEAPSTARPAAASRPAAAAARPALSPLNAVARPAARSAAAAPPPAAKAVEQRATRTPPRRNARGAAAAAPPPAPEAAVHPVPTASAVRADAKQAPAGLAIAVHQPPVPALQLSSLPESVDSLAHGLFPPSSPITSPLGRAAAFAPPPAPLAPLPVAQHDLSFANGDSFPAAAAPPPFLDNSWTFEPRPAAAQQLAPPPRDFTELLPDELGLGGAGGRAEPPPPLQFASAFALPLYSTTAPGGMETLDEAYATVEVPPPVSGYQIWGSHGLWGGPLMVSESESVLDTKRRLHEIWEGQ